MCHANPTVLITENGVEREVRREVAEALVAAGVIYLCDEPGHCLLDTHHVYSKFMDWHHAYAAWEPVLDGLIAISNAKLSLAEGDTTSASAYLDDAIGLLIADAATKEETG